MEKDATEPAVRVTFVLDTPNLTHGVPTAGLPARIVSLAAEMQKAGAQVSFVLGDRGMTGEAAQAWQFPGVLVNPRLLYGDDDALVPHLAALSPDFIVIADSYLVANKGRRWAEQSGARLVYEAHDDEAQLSHDLGESEGIVRNRRLCQRKAAQAADFVTVLTEREYATMKAMDISEERLLLAPIGVDLDERTHWGPDPQSRKLLLIGNLYYEPNARAVEFLIELVEELNRNGHAVSARVVGRGPDELTQREVDGVEFLGAVHDLDQAMNGVALGLAPITVGSGQKKKMLDYLAAGLPVVSTAEAANGYDGNQPGIIIADDLEAWARLVVELLADEERLLALGAEGRCALSPHFESSAIAARAFAAYLRWRSMSTCGRDSALDAKAEEPYWLHEHTLQSGLGEPHLTAETLAVCLPVAAEKNN